jgi:nucleotide-binding universal stress UspA family protein
MKRNEGTDHMYQTILLCTDGSPAADGATESAIWLAGQLKAQLHAIYVTDIRVLEGPLLADLAGAIGAQPFSTLLPQIQQLQRDKADTILAAVQAQCRERRVACEVEHQTGNLVHALLAAERNADLVVLGQHGEHAPWHGELLGSTVERVVRASTKPCLVTPAAFHPPHHILMAYDGSAESAGALRAGFTLAESLGVTEVTIVTVCQRDHEDAAAQSLQQAHQQALTHKLTVHAQLVHGHPDTGILTACDNAHADLIVMGAYGHTRIRELIVGSTTSQVLRKARTPVLLVRGAAGGT